MALILSIDWGTSNFKVGVVNEKGELLSMASSKSPKFLNSSNIEEQDLEALQDLIIHLCQQVLRGIDRSKIKYIISASFQFGILLLDKENIPLTGMTLLTDTRSQKTFSDFKSFYKEMDLYQRTGCPLISQYVLPRLYYFSQKEPELFEKASSFMDSKSFLFEWFTGERVTDESTASATQFYNIHSHQWDGQLLALLGLSAEQFPKIEDGTQFKRPIKKEISELLGLGENVEMILGLYDGAALSMGLGGMKKEVGIINLGTSAMIRVPGNAPIFDKNKNKRIQAYAVRKNLFLNGGALNNATLPLDWLKENLFEFNLNEELEESIPQLSAMISLPYLTGERDSLLGPYASGVFFGIRKSHGRSDFIRSILEGVAFSIRYIYEAFEENGIYLKEIRMGGGGSCIKGWPQIFADVLEIPIIVSGDKEMALVGNAFLVYQLIESSFDPSLFNGEYDKKEKKIIPNQKSVIVRRKQYPFYKKLKEQLGPLFEDFQKISD